MFENQERIAAPRFGQIRLELILSCAYPRCVLLLRDSHGRVPQEDRYALDRYAAQQLDVGTAWRVREQTESAWSGTRITDFQIQELNRGSYRPTKIKGEGEGLSTPSESRSAQHRILS